MLLRSSTDLYPLYSAALSSISPCIPPAFHKTAKRVCHFFYPFVAYTLSNNSTQLSPPIPSPFESGIASTSNAHDIYITDRTSSVPEAIQKKHYLLPKRH